jgi:hypothetical protein
MAGIATPAVIAAITSLRRGDGTIHPEDVVESARATDSPLHTYFEWDDSAAAAAYRIDQARHLLRVTVTHLPTGSESTRVRAFVSLSTDAGYRPIGAVLINSQHRQQLLADARAEMERFERKYGHLTELAEVITAMRSVDRRKLASAG